MKKKVLAICGSTRKESVNLNLVHAIAVLANGFEVEVYEKTGSLPQFNPDDDLDPVNERVAELRRKIRQADGVLICTPEYAMGVPGTLKNALDWTVSSADFSKKPVALITASLGGEKAHASLLGTLEVIEAHVTEQTQLLISFARTKVSRENTITDAATLEKVKLLLEAFTAALNESTNA